MKFYLFIFFLVFIHIHPVLVKASEEKAIYGTDDRVEINSLRKSPWISKARATAAMINREDLIFRSFKDTFTLKSGKTLKSVLNICPEEAFGDQPVVADCTGFLVAPNQILTAGHCIPNQVRCDDIRWVFDYALTKSGYVRQVYEKDQVYQCKRIIDRQLDRVKGIDYALIELYRKVKDRTPLILETAAPQMKTPLVMIGHPSGLPSKLVAGDAHIVEVMTNSFKANLDSFGGNSGSPVFNAQTGNVLGILISGSPDYDFDETLGCRKNHHCTQENCHYETISFVSNLNLAGQNN